MIVQFFGVVFKPDGCVYISVHVEIMVKMFYKILSNYLYNYFHFSVRKYVYINNTWHMTNTCK